MLYHFTRIILLISIFLTTVLTSNQNYNDTSLKLKRDEQSSEYYYSLLDGNEKKFYDELKDKLEQGLMSQHSLYEFDLTEVAFAKTDNAGKICSKIIKALMLDNPKYFWLYAYYQSIETINGKITGITLNFLHMYPEDQLIGMFQSINKSINSLIQEVNALPTNCQKLKRIHDYLIKEIVYTLDEEFSRFNIYGALVDNACVCEGYAESFKYLCQQVGISSIVVEGEDHEWNLVQMEDGQWYGMDVTFDDPSNNGISPISGDDSNLWYYYFLAGRNTRVKGNYGYTTYGESKDHQINMSFAVPTVAPNAYDCSSSQETQTRCGGEYGRCPAGQCCSSKGYCGTGSSFCSANKGCQSAYGDCKCGGENGSCPAGQCCSSMGYCGTTKAHCSSDKGCQSEFGDCKCGKDFGKCGAGQCCSKKGYCGTTKAYCSSDKGCQSEFGDCRCGSDFGKCDAGKCCSKKGYCGTTKAYCYSSNGCQAKFGDCRCGSGMGSCSNYCCSSKGYCGTSASHCSFSKGCQSAFGECRCGKDFGNCEASFCCSSKGYCGKSAAYCSTTKGCNSYYGDCKCGGSFGSCASNECCSKKGYCGTTFNYCALSKGSQCDYGQCDRNL